MRNELKKNIPASIKQRLLNLRGEFDENFMLILNRYVRERLLYRIGISSYRDRFILKGAALFALWYDKPHRMTQDIDLLGLGVDSINGLIQVFQEICSYKASDDGLLFLTDKITGEEIRADQVYGGIRIRLDAYLGNIYIPMQIDIGFGDIITPGSENVKYPTLLDLPAPELLAYPRETVIAEKTHAIVVLGMANSRMKDFYDLWLLTQNHEFDIQILSNALQATFKRRQTIIPEDVPFGLTEEFGLDVTKRIQWQAFLRKSGLDIDGLEFTIVLEKIRNFLLPLIEAARKIQTHPSVWRPSIGWS